MRVGNCQASIRRTPYRKVRGFLLCARRKARWRCACGAHEFSRPDKAKPPSGNADRTIPRQREIRIQRRDV
ncbi:hypothetical protein ABF55_01490 [Enterobacter asburiae]|nr:hypothetical protein YA44_03005 [Enterobacter asburiae]KLP51355.1 hypothetical protein ABF55_01490 [Enterobacter asburiae]